MVNPKQKKVPLFAEVNISKEDATALDAGVLSKKQIVHYYLALQNAVRFWICHTKSSDVGVGKRVGGTCDLLEYGGTGTQIRFLFGGEVIG